MESHAPELEAARARAERALKIKRWWWMQAALAAAAAAFVVTMGALEERPLVLLVGLAPLALLAAEAAWHLVGGAGPDKPG